MRKQTQQHKGSIAYEAALREMKRQQPNAGRALVLLEDAIRIGSPEAEWALGTWYLHGHHVRRSMKRAARLLRRAAQAGVPDAMYELGVCFEHGEGVTESPRRAMEWYLRAALRGDGQAVLAVGLYLYYGIVTPRNTAQAWIWLDRAAELGVRRLDGEASPTRRTRSTSVRSTKEISGGNQGAATYREALREVSKKRADVGRVKELLKKALKSGNPDAAYALATWYLHGHNVQRDLKQAVLLLRQAAKANVPSALFDLAICYEKGAEVRKNDRLALEHYIRAALRGDEQSVYEVGRCFYFGIGAPRDTRWGSLWFDRAKELGVT